MDKQGQGLPITTVILAILGIVVLVILFAIMTGRLTIFAGAANECPGTCVQPESYTGPIGPGIVLRQANECTAGIEKQLHGSFIAQVRDDDNKPVVCGKCCQRLA